MRCALNERRNDKMNDNSWIMRYSKNHIAGNYERTMTTLWGQQQNGAMRMTRQKKRSSLIREEKVTS